MILDELQDVLGAALYRRFVNVFAATVVTFPKAPDGPFFAELVRVVGADAAERVRLHFAGSKVYIPRDAADERKRRDMEIIDRINSGETPESIARTYRLVTRVSIRTVQRIAAAASKTDPDPKKLSPT